LRGALSKLKGRPLVGAIGSVGVRHDAKAVGALTRLLRNPDTQVANAAARALGKIGTSDAAKVLKKALGKAPPDRRLAVADACLSCAEALVGQDKRSEAEALYRDVGSADLPKHFRLAAAQGAIRARKE
jgi:HEAT repeat protein